MVMMIVVDRTGYIIILHDATRPSGSNTCGTEKKFLGSNNSAKRSEEGQR
jgi:hypothetical protein